MEMNKKCVFCWLGIQGCLDRMEQEKCNNKCEFFVHINSPQGDLMLQELENQKNKSNKED